MSKYVLDLVEDLLEQIREVEGADIQQGKTTEMVFVMGFKQYMDMLETTKRLKDELDREV